MKRLVKSALAVTLVIISLISFSSAALADCSRTTDDAGRWRDPMKPSDRIAYMCILGLDYYPGEVSGITLTRLNPTDCTDLFVYAQANESWHGDWFLWSEIQCSPPDGMRMIIK